MHLCFSNARLIHSKSDMSLEILQNKAILVDKQKGVIIQIFQNSLLEEKINKFSQGELQVIQLNNKQFLIPGLIDTHSHAPQFANNGCALDLELMQWLIKYTFPEQRKFQDCQYAHKVYNACVSANICNGTTTICFYGSIHKDATNILAQIMEQKGVRGYVGKVCMDQNAPQYYIEQNYLKSCQDTIQFIQCTKQKTPSITPVVTPRFAPTCSEKLMQQLGKISEIYDIPIQTHLSENKTEIQLITKIFPNFNSYTQLYQKTGLLGKKSVLAHCVHLSTTQMQIMKCTKSGISHCPNSNISVRSGIAPIRKYLQYGLKVGLGSDCSGGYMPSILDSIRYAILSSKIYNYLHPQFKPLTFSQAFYLGTRGGAQLLNIENKVGHFGVGMQFDALLIDYNNFKHSYISEEEPMIHIFEKMLYLMNQNQISKVYVNGKQIKK